MSNPLPQLLHTPAGMALLELQGTFNLPVTDADADGQTLTLTQIGRVVFDADAGETKRVYMYVGEHQRMTGEIKALPKPVAIVRRRRHKQDDDDDNDDGDGGGQGGGVEELEIVEIVKFKIVFSQRPEPVSTG